MRGPGNLLFYDKVGFPTHGANITFNSVGISVSDESANDSVRDETTFEMQHNAAAISFLPNLTASWEIECLSTHKWRIKKW